MHKYNVKQLPDEQVFEFSYTDISGRIWSIVSGHDEEGAYVAADSGPDCITVSETLMFVRCTDPFDSKLLDIMRRFL